MTTLSSSPSKIPTTVGLYLVSSGPEGLAQFDILASNAQLPSIAVCQTSPSFSSLTKQDQAAFIMEASRSCLSMLNRHYHGAPMLVIQACPESPMLSDRRNSEMGISPIANEGSGQVRPANLDCGSIADVQLKNPLPWCCR